MDSPLYALACIVILLGSAWCLINVSMMLAKNREILEEAKWHHKEAVRINNDACAMVGLNPGEEFSEWVEERGRWETEGGK